MTPNQSTEKPMNVEEMNQQLIKLVKSERKIIGEVLNFLLIFHKCDGPIKYGCSSLYQYLTQNLHYSEDQAYRRLKAVKLLEAVPVVSELFERGALNLSQAAKTQQAFEQYKKEQDRELELETKKSILFSMAGLDNFNTERILAETLKLKNQSSAKGFNSSDKVKPLADGFVRVEVTLNKGQFDKLNELKSLLSHQVPQQDLASVLEALFDFYLAKKGLSKELATERRSKEVRDSLNITQAFKAKRVKKPSRYIPKKVHSEVFRRARGCCEFVGQEGNRCFSRYKVQVDHRVPFSQGGSSVNSDNLQILCSRHNQWAASQMGIGYETIDLFEGIGFMS